MPLTGKGESILENMQKNYGTLKGEKVFYASANKGTIKGVHNDRRDTMGETEKGSGYSHAEHQAQVQKMNNEMRERKENKGKDQIHPDPATGPMSTKGPSAGKSEGLPVAATPSSQPANDCGQAMSLDAIKSAGKRIGKY